MANLNQQTASLTQSNLVLAATVEGLRRENAQLVETVSKMPHRQVLTYDAAMRVIELLKAASDPKMKVRVLQTANWWEKGYDNDSAILAEQIVRLFRSAGFTIDNFEEYHVVTDGVEVRMKIKPTEQMLAALNQLFKEIGQPPDIMFKPGLYVFTGDIHADPNFDITILVGPPPLFDFSPLGPNK